MPRPSSFSIAAVLALACSAAPSQAEEHLAVALDAQAMSTNGGFSWTFDPAYDIVDAHDWPPDLRYGVLEFSIGDIPAGSTVTSAELIYRPQGVSANSTLELHGYPADGVLELADALRPDNLVGSLTPGFSFELQHVALDPAFVQSLLGRASHLGLRTSVANTFTSISMWSSEATIFSGGDLEPPTLRVVYTPPSSGCATSFHADFGTVSSSNTSVCVLFPDLFETCRGASLADLSDGGSCSTPGDVRMYISGGFPAPEAETVCLDLLTTPEAALVFSYSRFPEDSGPFVAVRLPGQQPYTIWLPPFTNEIVCATAVVDLAELGLIGQQEVRFIFYGSSNLELTSFDDIELVLNPGRCVCDFDPSTRIVDVFDLLAYLDLWFSVDEAAEMTQDTPAHIDVFDLLSFLDCWFMASRDPAVCL